MSGHSVTDTEESAESESTTTDEENATPSGTMTLAFEVEAIQRLADPAIAFEDARTWSSYIGVISDKLGYQVVNYLREQGVYNEDFFSRADKVRSLEHVQSSVETDRYVLVGPSGSSVAETVEGWEFLPVEEAARKADWETSPGSDEPDEQY